MSTPRVSTWRELTLADDGNTSLRIQKKVKDAVGTAVSSLKSLAGVEDK